MNRSVALVPVADAAQTLSDRLASLAFTPQEAAVFDAILRRAEAVTQPDVQLLVGGDLIAAAVQTAIVARTARALGIDIAEARGAFADALTFLSASAHGYGVALSPSAKVDEAWHQFILFTVDYGRYCDASFGHFVHHVPSIGVDDAPARNALSPAQTFDFLTARGHKLDPYLWRAPTVADALAHLHIA